ncbi:hypothetical protein BDC45DRAFT_587920 [Circinella umbellata]|nr:hypothetical protein BDC45DRAFT_598842 [Circinella umbellata]KAI7852897.1 hypothetical protein BDC45DRAFT_587920 [Circinella umbellata]
MSSKGIGGLPPTSCQTVAPGRRLARSEAKGLNPRRCEGDEDSYVRDNKSLLVFYDHYILVYVYFYFITFNFHPSYIKHVTTGRLKSMPNCNIFIFINNPFLTFKCSTQTCFNIPNLFCFLNTIISILIKFL